MSYSNLPILATGDWIDAAYGNQYWGDNFRALWPYTTAGDLGYGVSASANLARLGISTQGGMLYSTGSAPAWLTRPSADSILRHVGGAANPSWLAIGGLPGVLHAKATVDYNANDQDITSTSFTDITGATVNIVTTRTCTIRMIGTGTFAAGSGGERIIVQGSIGGTGSGDSVHTSMTVYVPFTVVYYRTGVAAGTITCKLQGRGNAAGNNGFFHQGRIIVDAFVE